MLMLILQEASCSGLQLDAMAHNGAADLWLKTVRMSQYTAESSS